MLFPVEDWEAIPLDTYKALFLEVKERFDTTTEEEVSCTDKSIKCMLAFITYLLAVVAFLLTNHQNINWMCVHVISTLVLIMASAYDVYLGYTIITLRPSHTGGLMPDNVLSNDYNLSSGFNKSEKLKLFYYKAILTYMQKISENTEDNTVRAKKYDTFFRLTLLLILLIGVFALFAIFFHPGSVKF